MQREVIEAALKKQDVFVQAATSFGKSLCFQLPAVIDTGSKYHILSTYTFALTRCSHNSRVSFTCPNGTIISKSTVLLDVTDFA